MDLGEIRKDSSNIHYKLNRIRTKTDQALCFQRKGAKGRFSLKETAIPLKTYEKLVIAEPAPKSDTPQPESHTVRILRREIDNLKKRLTQHKTGEGIIIQAVQDCYEDPPDLVIPETPEDDNRAISDNEIAVLHISDTQIGKTTRSYDCAKAEERLIQLVHKTIAITNTRRSAAKIEEIHVYLGGDMVEGEEIFATQAHEIEQGVFDQAVRTAPAILTKCILILLKHFKKVVIKTVPGNHGRNGAHGGRAHPRTNWDNVCYELTYWMLQSSEEMRSALAGRLDFQLNDKWYEVDYVYGWGNLIVHGDQITGGFSGFPYYGVGKKAWGWIDSIPEAWSYLWFGHFHTYASGTLNHRFYLANGTTESDNVYAQSQLAATGYPCQRLSFFNKKHGLISDSQIFLTDDRKPCK